MCGRCLDVSMYIIQELFAMMFNRVTRVSFEAFTITSHKGGEIKSINNPGAF